MANLNTTQAIFDYLHQLIEQHIVTEDDQLIFDAYCQNDIRHSCQAIRNANTSEVELQHLTLRFGSQGEQSVYQFDLSPPVLMCLDLYSLFLAIRHTQFQLEMFHPDLISNVVLPIQVETLLWEPSSHFLREIVRHHAEAFRHVVPSLQGDEILADKPRIQAPIDWLRKNTYALWFEVSTTHLHFERIADYAPDMIKLVVTLEDKQDRKAFLPIARFLRRHHYPWVAGRVACQIELNRFMLLGASYYFGYFSDIPTSLSFKAFDEK